MSTDYPYALARPILFAMDAEKAHHLTLNLLKKAAPIVGRALFGAPESDPRKIMGIHFPNPVGLAAGLDKDGSYIDALSTLGFGSIEIGTVTPRPQSGNPKPRMFRLPEAQAIINRMGFNNGGVEAFILNVQRSKLYQEKSGILGLNIGKNADTPIERAAEDYLHCLEKVYPFANYVTVNISSPNTKNLRQLQGSNELEDLLSKLKVAQLRLADQFKHYVPIALKIAPDIDAEQIKVIADRLVQHKFDAVIASNTTLGREGVKGLTNGEETGGLSGAPLFGLSNSVIRALKAELGDAIPIIGVGGILTGRDAKEKMQAGADLVQIYSGLIYRGPALVRECVEEIKR